MKRFVASLALALALVGATSAYAESATGVIRGIHATDRTITLDNGQTYTIDAKVDISQFRTGQRVTVTFEVQNGQNMATEVVTAAA